MLYRKPELSNNLTKADQVRHNASPLSYSRFIVAPAAGATPQI